MRSIDDARVSNRLSRDFMVDSCADPRAGVHARWRATGAVLESRPSRPRPRTRLPTGPCIYTAGVCIGHTLERSVLFSLLAQCALLRLSLAARCCVLCARFSLAVLRSWLLGIARAEVWMGVA